MDHTILSKLDLRETKGLETVRHKAPSTIGFDTIYESQGEIPDVFLRGAGVPEDMISYIYSTAGAIQFYSCFISYSFKDRAFAERLYADLQAKGLRVWFAPEDISGGKKIHEQIEEAIQRFDKLLLVLSDTSMNSEWGKTETYHARQYEAHSNKRKLFPISLVPYEDIRQWSAFDVDIGKDMAREVREYFIPDFANWKDHDAYQKGFDRLLRDLQASEEVGEG